MRHNAAIDPKAELARLRQITIWRALNEAAARDPQHHALVGADDAGNVSRLTYAELLRRVRDLSAGLAGIGVRRGDRVVLWMTNTFEWAIAAFAIMRIGAAVVPVNTFLKPPEIEYFIQQSGARHLLMLDSFRKLDMPQLLGQICPGLAATRLPGFLCSEALPDLRNVVLFSRSGGKLACAFDFAALAGDANSEDYELADRMTEVTGGSDLAMVKYTSGSTAFPKGVMLEQGGIVANAVLHTRRMGAGRADIYFSMMPFFHAGGSIYGLMSMLVHGGTLVFTETFNADLAVELIIAERATIVATMLGNEIVQKALAKDRVFPSVRVAALPDAAARKVMPNVTSGFLAFGLTETHGPAALSGYASGEESSVMNGRLLEGNEGRVVDSETGLDVPPGTPGELLLKGNVTRGYWNKPVETARAFTEDGWFHTEDCVSINAAGYLTWHGRLKLMLKIGGENVSIEEVERVVTSHESVAECCAVGMPDKRKGEAIRLYVRPQVGRTLRAEELHDWLKPQMAHFKLPREVIFVDTLPRLGSGKIDRVQLTQRARSEVQP